MSTAQARPAARLSLDLRLTTDDVARLSPAQTEALFEGVGRLAAQTVATERETPSG